MSNAFVSVDLEQSEVLGHTSRLCSSGHIAPPTWRARGPGTDPVPTRFFRISSKSKPFVKGVYCDICMHIANYAAKVSK